MKRKKEKKKRVAPPTIGFLETMPVCKEAAVPWEAEGREGVPLQGVCSRRSMRAVLSFELVLTAFSQQLFKEYSPQEGVVLALGVSFP